MGTAELPMFDVGAPCGTLDGYTREIQYFVSRLESGEPFDAVSADSSLGTVALCRKIIDGAKKI